jgi:CheY-like chemotaxis protein
MCDILVVEDNEQFRSMLITRLTARYPAAEVRAVETGEAAVKICEGLCPRVIFLDIMLPGINGLEVTEKIRSQHRSVRIAMVSGNDYPEYREAAERKGADFFISKNTARLEEILTLAGVLLEDKNPDSPDSDKFRLSSTT